VRRFTEVMKSKTEILLDKVEDYTKQPELAILSVIGISTKSFFTSTRISIVLLFFVKL
jgi:hypothetical protein